jgi:hypothetical protein
MRIYDDCPFDRAGKWRPEVELVAELEHPLVQGCRRRIGFYRLAYRATPGSPKTNARSLQLAVLPPGVIATNSVHPEGSPELRTNAQALVLLAVLNSFCVDAVVRLHVTANINNALLRAVRIPRISLSDPLKRFLAHAALLLVARHEGFRRLWDEQLGTDGAVVPTRRFPALGSEDACWRLRAAIDAAVAQALGYTADEYATILGQFLHRGYPSMQRLCLEKFDQLGTLGLQSFVREHDPYWSVPLNGEHPNPVVLSPPQHPS